MEDVVTGALLAWALAIAVADWRQRQVPNVLLLLLFVPALLVLALDAEAVWPMSGLASGLGMLIGLIVTLPGYFVKKLGAGDVKLAAVMGFVQGWPLVAYTLVLAGLVLGAMSLFAVLHLGFGNSRGLRMPAAVGFAAAFAATVVASWGDWL